MASIEDLTPLNKKLYVGCALTHAPEAFRDDVATVKSELTKDWEVLEFVGLTDDPAEDIYRNDVSQVNTADAMVAICDYPSLGLGGEMAVAWSLDKPLVGVAHIDTKVSKWTLGAIAVHPNYSFIYYENLVEDVPVIVREEFAAILGGVARLR